ncbi:MAG TPA: hypothetical protein VMM93_01690 [Vicinamibacterales bacterium]|nr:hypothetical protein [Vicinamibacterales bacterium]
MSDPAYTVARVIASRVLEHLDEYRQRAETAGQGPLAPQPDAGVIEAMVDTAFWASLRREEGQSPRISLAFVSPDLAGTPLRFRDPLPLHPAALAKLAPAVERASIHLGVWPIDQSLRVWGTARDLPQLTLVIEVAASGLLVIKQRGEPFSKFLNIAVLEGDQIKVVHEHETATEDYAPALRSLMGFDPFGAPGRTANLLIELAASMRAHGRGGALLRVPAGTSTWLESVVTPMPYIVDPPYRALADLVEQPSSMPDGRDWRDAVHHAVDGLAGLTAVDGATLIDDRYSLLAFGVKIRPRQASQIVDRVVVTEPIEGRPMWHEAPARLGGTRHLSAAQFVFDQHDAVAVVASQDGHCTIFRWSDAEDMVHAHRVETLLL